MTEKNEQQKKQVNDWLKYQKKYAHGKLSRAIALGSLNGLLMIIQTAMLAYLIDLVIFPSEDLSLTNSLSNSVTTESILFSETTLISMALVAVIFCRAALGYFSECYSRRGAMDIKANIRSRLLNRLFQFGPAYTQTKGSAKLSHLLHQGIDSLEDYFAGYLPVIAYCAVIPLAILIAVFPIDWQSGLILLITAPMVPFFMILIGHKAQRLNQEHWAKLQRMSSHFLDIIQGLTQLKIFNASRREIAAVKKISDDYGDETMGILKIAFLSSFVLEFLASISIALVAVVLGFRLYYGDVDYVFALWVLLLAPEFYLPFRQLGTQYHAKMAGVTAAEDLVEVLSQPQVHYSLEEKFTAPFSISLVQAEFAYPDRSNALTQVNIEFSSQGLYAVIGESGSGKSTLIDMVLGFVQPDSGQVVVNNQPLTAANRDHWLKHCGWISQQAQVFYGSLAFNIALSDNYQDDLVIEALEKAGLASFVQTLEQGIESEIGEDGAGLSGGQAQRLALARVFYHQPDVLILDEPTSHLDQQTEQIITSSINAYAENHIVIVIAHRLHTVIDAKKIIVLEQGKVIETGTHQELLSHDGYYAQQVNV
ncbi:thiol reductant ABC exporter subunit CydD [Colwellia psychrerythraea]|uniref:ABC transporter, ATP-binding/permease protein CydD n=1 Tax=Colwellia psychrerythraea (strain 34H / ATCC BAA-681) TaxID=167879 RepID=Q484A6_COLP3|nr:thiol reductant ABC exporter subunit CydD [Colwellia psychrerythraea]AAZ26124.1 ABC transporter, ATP-binding/permease protein CydD [Colwellia psychrerythraea 34H]